MTSQLLQLQERFTALQTRANSLNSLLPVEVDELLVELDDVGNLAAQEADLVFHLLDRAGVLLKNAQKVGRLAMLMSVPLMMVMSLGASLGLTALSATNELLPYQLFALGGVFVFALVLSADRLLRAPPRANQDAGRTDERAADLVQRFQDGLDEHFDFMEQYAKQFDDVAQRRRRCDKPWKAAAALLALELAICIACERKLLFITALTCTVFGVLITASAACVIDHDEDGSSLGIQGMLKSGPANVNLLEKVVLVACRSPVFASTASFVAVLVGLPIANTHLLTPQAAKMAESRFRQAREVAAKARDTKTCIVDKLRKATKPAAAMQNFASTVTTDPDTAQTAARDAVKHGAALVESVAKSEAAQQLSSQVGNLLGGLLQLPR